LPAALDCSSPQGRRPHAIASTTTSATTSQTEETTAEGTEESTEESTESTEETSEELIGPGSPDLALAFVQQIASGDFESAFASLEPDFQAEYVDARSLATDFFETIGATSISSSTVSDAFGHGSHDDVVVDLETDTGSSEVLLAVIEEDGVLKVFDFVSG